MTTTASNIDVRPARVRAPGVISGAARVVTDGSRLVILTGTTPDRRTEFTLAAPPEYDKRRRHYEATTTGGQTITFGPGGGCTCGKPWMKTRPSDVLG